MTTELSRDKKPSTEVKIKFEKIVDLMIHWDKDNNYRPLSMKEAVSKVWIAQQTFIYYINTYPSLKEKYEAIKSAKREIIWWIAENNIHKALDWDMDIDDIDKARLSLDYLKSTTKEYNPKIEVNQSIKSININISDEELKSRIQELMSKLW